MTELKWTKRVATAAVVIILTAIGLPAAVLIGIVIWAIIFG